MLELMEKINRFVWGIPALLLIFTVGLYLTAKTRFAQLRLFPDALRCFFRKLKHSNSQNGVSSYQSLCTALAATVGTGNIAGVAGAISLGGPGALFWMLLAAFVGMIIKFAEAALAVKFSETDKDGNRIGGPMYMIHNGMGKRFRWLATIYAVLGLVAAFGVGNATQINAVLGGINAGFGLDHSAARDFSIGLIIAVLVAFAMLGGAKRIASFAERIVPVASIAYILLGLTVICLNYHNLPGVIASVLEGAFSPKGITGGAIGTMFVSLRIGVSRGVFTNEAGMGTASIAHAGADVAHPIEQGLMGIVEVFLDTIVICSITAFAILTSGIYIPYGSETGVSLTSDAFSMVCGSWSGLVLAAFLCVFAFATILGWGLYGCRCATFLFGKKALKPFVGFQVFFMMLSCLLQTRTIWLFAEIVNGLMCIPNLILLISLTPELIKLFNEFLLLRGKLIADGGTYESIDQCKSLRTLSHEKVPSLGGGS